MSKSQIHIVLLLIVVFFVPCNLLGAVNNDMESLPLHSLSEKRLAFQAGEKLNYVLHYKWGVINSDVANGCISIDTVSLDGNKVFKARICGRTAKFYDAFFCVREDFISWFTVDGLRPVRFVRDTREGGYYVYNTYSYMWEPASPFIDAIIESRNRARYTTQIPLKKGICDLPSIFCRARNLDFSKVKEEVPYPMVFAVDDEVFTVYLTYKGKESKYVKNIGNVNTLKFAATLVAGEVFSGKEDMYMWFTDDDNRIPVLFKAPIKVGEVSGYLESYEGLKYPFNSLVTQ